MTGIRLNIDGPRASLNADEVIERYYPRLQEWSLWLSRGDEHRAEDIVHDLCLHLSLTKPDLSRVENLDGYLYTALRHLYLAHLARGTRHAFHPNSNADYDFIKLAFLAHRYDDQLSHQNELRRICAYVVWRKASVKSASYFILQFFYELEPREIAEIACLPIKGVWDKVLKMRAEIKTYLAGDGHMMRSDGGPPPAAPQSGISIPTDDLFRELKQTILSARRGDCPPPAELLACYRAADAKTMSCALLDHVVSCEACLGEIQSFLRANSGGPTHLFGKRKSSAPHKNPSFRRYSNQQRVRSEVDAHRIRVLAHRPTRIIVALDGRTVASQDVSGHMSAQSVRINMPAVAQFVEVFSDQGIRLAYVSLADLPPGGPHEHLQNVNLSDGRWLRLEVSFDAIGIYGKVEYCDPCLRLSDGDGLAEEQALADDIEQVRTPGTLLPLPLQISPFPALPCEDATATTKSRLSLGKILQRLQAFFGMDPRISSAVLCGLGVLVLFAWSLHMHSHAPTAQDFFERTESAEAAAVSKHAEGVVVQTIRIETAKGSTRRTLHRDIQGKRHPHPTPHLGDKALLESLDQAGISWEDPLSVRSFHDWRNQQTIEEESVSKTSAGLLVLSTTVANPEIARESLAVRLSDLHAVKKTIELRNRGVIEIAELSYEVLPWTPASTSWFEPADATVALPEVHPSLHGAYPKDRPVNLDEAELRARLILHDHHGDDGEEIDVLHLARRIEIDGTVESESRKDELQRAFDGLASVAPNLRTYESIEHARSTKDPVDTIRTASPISRPSLLEEALLAKGRSRESVWRDSQTLLQAAISVSRRARQLEYLTREFSPTAGAMPSTTNALLNELVTDYAAEIELSLAREEQVLSELELAPATDTTEGKSSEIPTIRRAADANLSLCEAFVATTGNPSVSFNDGMSALHLAVLELHDAVVNINHQRDVARTARQQQILRSH